MVTEKTLERINELYHKSKAEGLCKLAVVVKHTVVT